MRIGIIGAGMIGLSLGYLLSGEHEVMIFEKEPDIGGLARSFRYGGSDIDRYYHFLFLNDYHTISLSKELGIDNTLRWNWPTMALYIDRKLYPFSTPWDLLRFPRFTLLDKLRFTLVTILISRLTNWKPLEQENGFEWFEKVYGHNIADMLWKPLMRKKFQEYCAKVNAAWSWNEIFRRSKCRKGFGKEKLGSFEGETKTLISSLESRITSNGGKILTNSVLRKITKNEEEIEVTSNKGKHFFDAVFSTVPSQVLNPYLPDEFKIKSPEKEYLSIRCATFLLKKPLSEHFLINVLDKDLPQAVIVETTNLNRRSPHRVYVPYYTPYKSRVYTMSDEEFRKMNLAFLQRINPNLKESDVILFRSAKDRFAQTIFDKGYSEKMDPYCTPLPGLYLTNQSHIYPVRSGINECIRLSKYLVRDLDPGLKERHFIVSE